MQSSAPKSSGQDSRAVQRQTVGTDPLSDEVTMLTPTTPTSPHDVPISQFGRWLDQVEKQQQYQQPQQFLAEQRTKARSVNAALRKTMPGVKPGSSRYMMILKQQQQEKFRVLGIKSTVSSSHEGITTNVGSTPQIQNLSLDPKREILCQTRDPLPSQSADISGMMTNQRAHSTIQPGSRAESFLLRRKANMSATNRMYGPPIDMGSLQLDQVLFQTLPGTNIQSMRAQVSDHVRTLRRDSRTNEDQKKNIPEDLKLNAHLTKIENSESMIDVEHSDNEYVMGSIGFDKEKPGRASILEIDAQPWDNHSPALKMYAKVEDGNSEINLSNVIYEKESRKSDLYSKTTKTNERNLLVRGTAATQVSIDSQSRQKTGTPSLKVCTAIFSPKSQALISRPRRVPVVSRDASQLQKKTGVISAKNVGNLISIDGPANFPTKARREKSAAVIQQKRVGVLSGSVVERRTGSTVNVQSLLAGNSTGSSRARNIRQLLSYPAVTASHNSISPEARKPANVGARSVVRVPDFLRAHLNKKRMNKSATMNINIQQNQIALPPKLISPRPEQEVIQQKPSFQITDLLNYPESRLKLGSTEQSKTESQKNMTESRGEVCIHAMQPIEETLPSRIDRKTTTPLDGRMTTPLDGRITTPLDGRLSRISQKSPIPPARNKSTSILFEKDTAQEITSPNLGSLLEESTILLQEKQRASMSLPGGTTEELTSPTFNVGDQLTFRRQIEFSPTQTIRDQYRPEDNFTGDLLSKTEIDTMRYTIETKRFIFKDEGGTASRGKLRVEKDDGPRPYTEIIGKLRNGYDFNKVEKLPIQSIREENYLPLVTNNTKDHGSTTVQTSSRDQLSLSSDSVLNTTKSVTRPVQQESQSTESGIENINLRVLNEMKAYKQLPPEFRVDQAPNFTEELFKDIVATFFKQRDTDIDLHTDNLDDFRDKATPVGKGFDKYMKLKLAQIAEEIEMQREGPERSDHETTDEEIELKKRWVKLATDEGPGDESGEPIRLISPTMAAITLPDYVLTSMNKRPGREIPGQGPRLAGSHLDPLEGRHEKAKSAFKDMAEFWKRQLHWQVYDQRTLTQVDVSISLSDPAFFKLARDAPEYAQPIAKVLPLSLFDDWKDESFKILDTIERRRQNLKRGLPVHVQIFDRHGDPVNEPGVAEDYIPALEQFVVKTADKGRLFVGRMILQFDYYESAYQCETRRQKALQLQQESFQRVNFERMLLTEILIQNPRIKQPPSFMLNIIRRMNIPSSVNKEKLMQLARQIESVYTFAMVKLDLMADLEDANPKVTCLVNQYKLKRSFVDAVPYYALKSYENQGKDASGIMNKHQTLEIMNRYSLLGKLCFIDTANFINSLKESFHEKHKCFHLPPDRSTLNYLLSSKAFKKYELNDLLHQSGTYPMDANFLSQLQKEVSNYFATNMAANWTTPICSFVEKVIKKEFKQRGLNSMMISKETQLNPFLARYFRQIRSLQYAQLAEKQHAELTSYLKFLVQFALANQHFSDIDESEEEGPVAPQKRPDEDDTKYAARREKWRAEEVKWKAAAQKKRDSNVTSAARNM